MLLGFHIQEGGDGWTDAVERLPAGAPVKFTSGWERCTEAKRHNPTIKTWVRHVTEQPHPYGDQEAIAREMFNKFVNPSAPFWPDVDYIQGWNEFYANSQDAEEKKLWSDYDVTCARIWMTEYRQVHPQLAHIRYVMSEAAVGNNIPLEVAAGAVEYDALVGYHPYFLVNDGVIDPGDWQYLSGRWATMDAAYRANGYYVDWIFGEGGAFRDAGSGWRHERVYNGQIDKYLEGLSYWLDYASRTPAYREGRLFGCTIFTTGGGTQWQEFELAQPYMNEVADLSRTFPYPPIDGPVDPPTGNMLINGGFNGDQNWTTDAVGNQIPNGWEVTYYEQPELRHLQAHHLPPDERPGAPNALIIEGDQVLKVFNKAYNWGWTISQAIGGLEPNAKAKLVVKINCHFDGRGDVYEPDDTTFHIKSNNKIIRTWYMTKELDRTWQVVTVNVSADQYGVIDFEFGSHTDWAHDTAIFCDGWGLYLDEEVDEPWEDELWQESVNRQAISLNPEAALQAAIFADGLVPIQSEFWYVTADGIQRAAMGAESLDGSIPRRVYWTEVPNWNNIRWYNNIESVRVLEPGEQFIDVSQFQAAKRDD